MIKRTKAKSILSAVNDDTNEHFNVTKAIRDDAPVTNQTTVVNSVNFDMSDDGAYVLRKPLVRNNTSAKNVLYNNSYFLKLESDSNGTYFSLLDVNTGTDNTNKILRFYDEDLDLHEISYGQNHLYIPYLTVVDSFNSPDHTILNVRVNHTNFLDYMVSLEENSFDSTTDTYDWYLTNSLSNNQLKRFIRIYKDEDAANTTYIFEIINPELNTITSGLDVGNAQTLDVNLLADNPYAIRDLYGYGYVSTTKVVPYVPVTTIQDFNSLTIKEITEVDTKCKILVATNPNVISKLGNTVILKAFLTTAATPKTYYCCWEQSEDDGITWKECPEFTSRFTCEPILVSDITSADFNEKLYKDSLEYAMSYLVTKNVVRMDLTTDYSINDLVSDRPDVLILQNPKLNIKYRFSIYIETDQDTPAPTETTLTVIKNNFGAIEEGYFDSGNVIKYTTATNGGASAPSLDSSLQMVLHAAGTTWLGTGTASDAKHFPCGNSLTIEVEDENLAATYTLKEVNITLGRRVPVSGSSTEYKDLGAAIGIAKDVSIPTTANEYGMNSISTVLFKYAETVTVTDTHFTEMVNVLNYDGTANNYVCKVPSLYNKSLYTTPTITNTSETYDNTVSYNSTYTSNSSSGGQSSVGNAAAFTGTMYVDPGNFAIATITYITQQNRDNYTEYNLGYPTGITANSHPGWYVTICDARNLWVTEYSTKTINVSNFDSTGKKISIVNLSRHLADSPNATNLGQVAGTTDVTKCDLKISSISVTYVIGNPDQTTNKYLASTTGTFSFNYGEDNLLQEDLTADRGRLFGGQIFFNDIHKQILIYKDNYIYVSGTNSSIIKVLNSIYIPEPITKLIAWRGYIIIFTGKAIYLAEYDGSSDTYNTRILSSSVGVSAEDADTVATILNSIYFKSGNRIYKLVPNLYAYRDNILNVHQISFGINTILENIVNNTLETHNFSYATSDMYTVFIPTNENKTLALTYDFNKQVWTYSKYPLAFDGVHMFAPNDVQLYKNNSGWFYFDKTVKQLLKIGEEAYLAENTSEEPSDALDSLADILPYGDMVHTDITPEYIYNMLINSDDITALVTKITPIQFLIDFGQKSSNYTIDKQFLETKIILATLSRAEMAPLTLDIYTDGVGKILHIDPNTDSMLRQTRLSEVGTLNTDFQNSTADFNGICKQLIVKYSGKGKTIRHVISGESHSLFKFYSMDVRHRLLPKKR